MFLQTRIFVESAAAGGGLVQLNSDLLTCKAEMLREYFGLEIDEQGNLGALPIVLDQYSPDMDRLSDFVLNIGNNVRALSRMSCFHMCCSIDSFPS